jgi:GT2 family glycosyltransferase
VVIVNWNTANLLQACLQSCLASPPPGGMDLIVVDNASSDDSLARALAFEPAVRVITNQHNAGFARANNQGLAESQGDYALLLNSDTTVPPGALAGLVEFMEGHPEAGACGPRLVQPDGRPQPFAFGGDPTPAYLLRRAWKRLLRGQALHDWDTTEVQAVDWVAGTCLCMRRTALEQVGPLDERLFMYFEDNDWCLRLRQLGWKVYYLPQVSILHLGGQSRKQNPQAADAYGTSLIYFYAKHYGRFSQLWLQLSLPVYRRLVRP